MQSVSADDKKRMEGKRLLISNYCNAKDLITSGRNQDAEAVRHCAVKAPNQPVVFTSCHRLARSTQRLKSRLAHMRQHSKVPKIAKLGNRAENAAEIPESHTERHSRDLVASAAKGAPEVRQLDSKEAGAECPHCASYRMPLSLGSFASPIAH